MSKKYFRLVQTMFVSLVCFAVTTFAQTAPTSFPNIKIKNFGQMDVNYYRGAQPKRDDFQSLKDLGIKTVIDLQGNPTDYEKSAVESLGMTYINIPMSGYKYPKAENIERFLKLINDPETVAFFVHCKAGIHRTGVVGAAYRFTKYGWGYDQVYKEMKNYDFSAGLFHRRFKTFVRDYAEQTVISKAKMINSQESAQANEK